jgi:hypothetical protein
MFVKTIEGRKKLKVNQSWCGICQGWIALGFTPSDWHSSVQKKRLESPK